MPRAVEDGGTAAKPFDPFDATPDRDPWARYAVLRAEEPVWEFAPGVHLVTRYADVRRCLLDSSALSNRSNFFLGEPGDFQEPTNITMMDPPAHTELRKVELAGFSRGPIRLAAPWIRDAANDLIEGLLPAGRADLSTDFGLLLTTQVIARLVGVPTGDAPQVVSWAHDITKIRPGPVDNLPSFTRLFDYLSGLVADRLQATSRPDDMITRLIDWAAATGTPSQRLPTHVYQLMAAGFPTTAYTLELLMYELLRRDLWGGLASDGASIEAAREEGLRHGSAIRAVFRLAVRELEVGGRTIRPGDRVVLALESANRDERVFDDPDEFRLGRRNGGSHLAFGAGIHLCLGAPLARLEIDTVLSLLRERLPSLRLADGFVPQRRAVSILNGLEHLPVEW
jgi:cytochrome P450 family 142 subfamily A polypeptide 1